MTDGHRRIDTPPRTRSGGMTLIELMVALAIGSFLMLGAITVFMQGRMTFRVNETVARVQENARFVLDAMEPDIRMGYFFGLTTRSARIANRAAQDVAHTIGPATCGNNWAIDLDNSVEASNNAYTWNCAASGGAMAGSDTLVVRRAAEDVTAAPLANTMYIQSWRLQPGQIFIGPPAPSTDATSEIHALVVNGYYVSQTSSLSTAGNTVPSLRVKTLGVGPTIVDQELLPGVEDLQIQFGVDTDPAGGAERGVIDRYVNADDAIFDPMDPAFLPDARILAVRLWVRVRAENIETGYENTNTYTYADRNFTANDNYRRVVISKTIYLRNARPAT